MGSGWFRYSKPHVNPLIKSFDYGSYDLKMAQVLITIPHNKATIWLLLQMVALFVAVLMMIALVCGVYIGTPDCWKLPYIPMGKCYSSREVSFVGQKLNF